jgi:hypothetical protein
MTSIDSGAPAPAPVEKVNSFQRIAGVLFSPSETFASIARRPDVLVPLVILLIISLVSGWTIAGRVDFTALAREGMEANPRSADMPPDQMNRMVRIMSSSMKAMTYASPLLSIVILLIIAGVLLLAFRLFGGEGNFKQAFSVTVYSWYPGLIKGIISLIVLLNRKSVSMYDLQNPVRSNLGFLTSPKTDAVRFALLSSLDIFTIWMLVLFIIGFAAISRLSKAKSAAIVIGLWVFTLLCKLGLASLQSAKMKS